MFWQIHGLILIWQEMEVILFHVKSIHHILILAEDFPLQCHIVRIVQHSYGKDIKTQDEETA